MNTLQLDLFINTNFDEEARRYRILDGLKKIHLDFAHNRIFPSLSNLIETEKMLRTILENAESIRKELPKRITGINLESQQLIYESPNLEGDDLKHIRELISWALPYIRSEIDEGQTISNFVDEHIEIEEVGLIPRFVEEGYLLIPDLHTEMLNVFEYQVSIFTSLGERYRNLKTRLVNSLPLHAIGTTPQSVKMELISKNRSMPNPATFIFETDLDFPFNETMLPIAKRKLLRQMYS